MAKPMAKTTGAGALGSYRRRRIGGCSPDALRRKPELQRPVEMLWVDRLGEWSSMPASRQAARSSAKALAVIAMMGIRRATRARIARVAAMPSMTGICTSIRIRSYDRDNAIATACSPSPAISTTRPAASSKASATS